VAKIKVQDYVSKQKADSESEVSAGLSDFEKGLLKTFTRMEIRSKRETVPVLLTEEIIACIDKLLLLRSEFIAASNPYLIATVGELSHCHGSDVLRKFTMDCEARKPHLLTSTQLQKHVAS